MNSRLKLTNGNQPGQLDFRLRRVAQIRASLVEHPSELVVFMSKGREKELAMKLSKSKLVKAAGLGAAVTILTAGAALAAVATGSVNVRSGPGTGYQVLDQLYAGEHVSVVDQTGGWCGISRAGADGWVSCAYLASGRGPEPGRYARVRSPGRYYAQDGFYSDYPYGYDAYGPSDPSVSFSFGFGSAGPTGDHGGDWHHGGDWGHGGDWDHHPHP